jgi:hypothetical protein
MTAAILTLNLNPSRHGFTLCKKNPRRGVAAPSTSDRMTRVTHDSRHDDSPSQLRVETARDAQHAFVTRVISAVRSGTADAPPYAARKRCGTPTVRSGAASRRNSSLSFFVDLIAVVGPTMSSESSITPTNFFFAHQRPHRLGHRIMAEHDVDRILPVGGIGVSPFKSHLRREAQGLPYVLAPRVLSRREWMERYAKQS